jgi:hypothetical protein
MFKNRVQRKIYGPKRDVLARGWRKGDIVLRGLPRKPSLPPTEA